MKAHPKIQNIVEAISNNQISVALKDINSLLSKEKSREKFPQETLETIQLLRGLCQARSEQFGDAKKVFDDFVKANAKNTNVDPDIQAWITYIASVIGLNSELQKFLEPLQPKTAPDEKTAVNQMGLIVKAYDFKGAQTAALKVYKDFKQPKYMFTSILFQYLSIVKAKEPPQDLVKALEICCMFITKLKGDLGVTDQAKALENLLNRQVIKLYTEILHKQKKRDLLVKTLKEFPKVFEDDYEKYFKYLLGLYQEEANNEVKGVILAKYAEIFQQNNNLDTFRLCYNLYKQCISFLITNISKDKVAQEANIAVASAHEVGEDGRTYQFAEDASFERLLGIFWNSLGHSYKIFEDNFKEHQHYRNAVKAALTAKLEILRQIMFIKIQGGKSITEGALIDEYVNVLKSYTRHFLRIFTFPDEIYPFLAFLPAETVNAYLSFLEEEVNQCPEKSRCIADVNSVKLRNILKGVGNSIEEVEKEVNELIKKYTDAMTVLYDNKKIVEKGERLDNDEYIVVLLDLVIRLLDHRGIHEVDGRMFALIVKSWYVAELVLEKTPYNFDIKVKLIQLYERFCVTEKLLDIYKTMDIKAVQTDTLGYIFYKLHASLHMIEPLSDYIKENIRFHIESLKESKESLVSCLKYDNFEKVEEFWEWDKLMQRSYFKHISYLHLAQNELHSSLRRPAGEGAGEITNLNFEYFIDQIITRYNAHLTQDPKERFTFNFDVKTPQRNIVTSAHTDSQVLAVSPADEKKVGKIHIDYLTTLNNPVVLATRAYRLDLLYSAVQPDEVGKIGRLERALQGLKGAFDKVHIDGFFDFRQFDTKTKEASLLHVTHKDGFEYTFVKEMAEFERSTMELELALGNLYHFWLEVVLKKEEKEGEALLKEAENKFEAVFGGLEKAFGQHRQEPWRIYITDLRKLATVLDSLEALEIIGTGLLGVKSQVTKVVKKFSDSKQFTNLYKATQAMLKTFKERLDAVFGTVGGIMNEISEGLKNDTGYIVKDYIADIEKLFNAEVYNIAHSRKNFVTELNRSLLYLLTIFLGKLKEKSNSKVLKSFAA